MGGLLPLTCFILNLNMEKQEIKIFVAVVSHGHEKLISKLSCLSALSKQVELTVVLKNNVNLIDSTLPLFAKENEISFIDEMYGLGFGENNNYIYNWCVEYLGLSDDDFFLVLNPDVSVDFDSILSVVRSAIAFKSELSTVNLYKDKMFNVQDDCVRSFPSLVDFIMSYVGLGNKTIIDKSAIYSPQSVDWAAGSFLLFRASLYRKLGGFDSGYFMYCEDIDICWRAQMIFNQKLLFYPNIKAIHFSQHANRKLFSKHFVWHVKSMFRYLLMRYGLRKPFLNK